MPELPEVETVRIGLNQNTLGWQIEGGEVLLPRAIAYPDAPEAFLASVIGAEFIEWQRRGKYLLAKLSQGHQLGVHLRMTGSLLWCDRDAPLGKHTRVRLFMNKINDSQSKELRFDDQRTFGKMWWVPSNISTESIITGLQKLGLEPFDPEFTPHHLEAKLSRTGRPIKTVLLIKKSWRGLAIFMLTNLYFSAIFIPNKKQTLSTLNKSKRCIKQLSDLSVTALLKAVQLLVLFKILQESKEIILIRHGYFGGQVSHVMYVAH